MNDRATSVEEGIDPKELTEAASHLRTVHFGLIVACLACLVALSVEGPREIRAARDGFTRLRTLEGRDPGVWLLEAIGRERAEESITAKGKRFVYVHPDYELMLRTVGGMASIDMVCQLPDLIVSAGGRDRLRDAFFFYEGGAAPATGVGKGALAVVRRPADARATWDALGAATSFVYVPRSFALKDPPFLVETPTALNEYLQRIRLRFPLDFQPCAGGSLVRAETPRKLVVAGCWTGPTNQLFHFELELEKHPLPLLSKLARHLDLPSAEPSFARAFPELAERMVGPAAQAFDVLDSELAGEDTLALREETLEIFSVDVPLARLNSWGTLILLAVQLYLLIHLGNFTAVWGPYAMRHGAPYFPWIGLYPGMVARLVTTASICALPAAVVATLSWRELWVREAASGLRWAAVVSAALLALLAWRQLRRLRRIAERAPSRILSHPSA